MEYSREQRMALSKVLLDILSVDESIDSRETILFERIKDKLNLTAQDHFEVLQLNTLKCLSTIKNIDTDQKMEFAQMMKEMILADEFIDPNEAVAFYDICEFVRLTGVGLSE